MTRFTKRIYVDASIQLVDDAEFEPIKAEINYRLPDPGPARTVFTKSRGGGTGSYWRDNPEEAEKYKKEVLSGDLYSRLVRRHIGFIFTDLT